jgi:hypothetical protein
VPVCAEFASVRCRPRHAGPPAVRPATLTIIEIQEGHGPAVTEVQGSVLGAIALIGFAAAAAASTAKLPLAAALLVAFATWVVVAIGGYLAQTAGLPSWQRNVRDLAWRRREPPWLAAARNSHLGPTIFLSRYGLGSTGRLGDGAVARSRGRHRSATALRPFL